MVDILDLRQLPLNFKTSFRIMDSQSTSMKYYFGPAEVLYCKYFVLEGLLS